MCPQISSPGYRAPFSFLVFAVCGSAVFAIPGVSATPAWTAAACGTVLALVLAQDAAAAARDCGVAPPSFASAAVTAAAAIAASAVAFTLLPALRLEQLLPGWLAGTITGAAFGLWTAMAAFPLHVRLGSGSAQRAAA